MLVDRNATEDPVVLPTIDSKTTSIEYIAMIDIKQTRILEVFPSQKEAAMARNLSGFSTISRAIKKNCISSGHYWQLYRLCSPEMRDAYLQDHALPEPHVKSNGTTVQQLHPITGDIVQSYPSIMEVQKHFQMSRATLYAASNQQTVHHGFKWNIMVPAGEEETAWNTINDIYNQTNIIMKKIIDPGSSGQTALNNCLGNIPDVDDGVC